MNLFSALISSGDIPKIDAMTVFIRALNITYIIIGIIAVVAIILAGFTLITSAGNAEAIKKGKNTILYAIIGLIFIALAYTITFFVTRNFGA